MFDKREKSMVSPSRTYVAMCNKTNFDGYYFKKFDLPENTDENRQRIWGPGVMTPEGNDFQIENNASWAVWFFMSELNLMACIEKCFPIEDFNDVVDEKPWWKADYEPLNLVRHTCETRL